MNKKLVGATVLGLALVTVGLGWLWIVDARKPSKNCEVHGIPLQDGFLTIEYGLLRLPEEEVNARGKLFPNSHSFYNNGCVVGLTSPKFAFVTYCPECRKAELDWKVANKRN